MHLHYTLVVQEFLQIHIFVCLVFIFSRLCSGAKQVWILAECVASKKKKFKVQSRLRAVLPYFPTVF